jgi:hypothetical protein
MVCFSTDQTVGSQGKYIGLGQQGDNHDKVSVILPLSTPAKVNTFIIKVAQGSTAGAGDAWVYHDSASSDKGSIVSTLCKILPGSPNEAFTKCILSSPLNFTSPLGIYDSISVFVKTDSGNFQGVSACVQIEPL